MKLDPEMEAKILAMPGTTVNGLPLNAPSPDAKVSEKEFQQAVIDLAKRHGWKVYHTYDSRRSNPGYPDLTLVRERVLWMELKVHPNKPTAAQGTWVEVLKSAGQAAYVFYPEHWPIIVKLLEGK